MDDNKPNLDFINELKVSNSTMYEAVFTADFLHDLYGFIINKEEPTERVLKWVEYSGSWFNEVDIVDTKNNILFTVPGLLNTIHVNESVDYTRISNLMHEGRRRNNAMPNSGAKYIEKGFELQQQNTEVNSNTPVWANVFMRYGLITENEVPTQSVNNSEFDY